MTAGNLVPSRTPRASSAGVFPPHFAVLGRLGGGLDGGKAPGIAILTVPLVALTLALAAELGAILLRNGGRFLYTLDDPYIHLALARHISQGHYGVNAIEPSAPSSSILWPFLLAPFARFPFGQYVPLVLNLACSFGIVVVVARIVEGALAPLDTRRRRVGASALVCGLALATSSVALPFTGMEHSLHVLISVLVVHGVLRSSREGAIPWWLPVVIVAGPLVRYEGLVVALPALAWLAWQRRFVLLGGSAALIAAGVGGMSLFLHAQGLGTLPTSVLSKSRPLASASKLSALLANIHNNAATHIDQTLVMILAAGLLARVALDRGARTGDRILAILGALPLVGHFVLGRCGWFARYEVYAYAVTLLMLLHAYRAVVSRLLDALPPAWTAALVSAVSLCVGLRFLGVALYTPLASRNIYEQQYQMHRFVAEHYKGAVAVADLGLVAYQNDSYVLDLEGLASREALTLRRSAPDSEWASALARRYGVRFAMITTATLSRTPRGWIRAADLHLGVQKVTAATSVVSFFALDPETAAQVRPMLELYRETLPEGVRLVVY